MKELDENGKQIGDLINPNEETNIVPVKKKKKKKEIT